MIWYWIRFIPMQSLCIHFYIKVSLLLFNSIFSVCEIIKVNLFSVKWRTHQSSFLIWSLNSRFWKAKNIKHCGKLTGMDMILLDAKVVLFLNSCSFHSKKKKLMFIILFSFSSVLDPHYQVSFSDLCWIYFWTSHFETIYLIIPSISHVFQHLFS